MMVIVSVTSLLIPLVYVSLAVRVCREGRRLKGRLWYVGHFVVYRVVVALVAQQSHLCLFT